MSERTLIRGGLVVTGDEKGTVHTDVLSFLDW